MATASSPGVRTARIALFTVGRARIFTSKAALAMRVGLSWADAVDAGAAAHKPTRARIVKPTIMTFECVRMSGWRLREEMDK